MRAAPTFAAIILSASAGACTTMADEAVAAGGAVVPPAYTPAEGLLLYREGPIEGAPDHHLVMGDLVLSAGTAVARHFHTGEEYLYVLAGEFQLTIEDGEGGSELIVLGPGDSWRVPPRIVHSGKAGPVGARGISAWVTENGQPLRVQPPG